MTRNVEVLAHRGASALRPEHTLAAYAQAIADGADFIEPDLVISRDGVLVVRHEPNIAETTDVARHPEFASQRTDKLIDAQVHSGWFAEDFTLGELKSLKAVERLPLIRPGNAELDGQFALVTWEELIAFAAEQSRTAGRPIGLVPELKHSSYFRSIGLPLEDRFLASLSHPYARECPLIVQSFEITNLKYLRGQLGRTRHGLRLMQLIDPLRQPADIAAADGALTASQMMELAGLEDIAAYADILAPDTRSLIPLTETGELGQPTSVIADAHAAGLQVMPYTFRPENCFLPPELREAGGPVARNEAGSVAEIRRYVAAGIDGFFTDDPALGRRAVDASPSDS